MKKIALLLTIFLISIPLVKTVQAAGIEDVRKIDDLKWGDYFIRPQMNHEELLELERFSYELMVSLENMDSRRAMQMYEETYLIRVVAGGNIKRIKTRSGWITPRNSGEYYNKKIDSEINERY